MHETPAESAAPSPALLEARGVSRRFGPVHALQQVDFTLRAAEIHALMGENGAGKSTLIKCLTGVHRPDAGEIRLQTRTIAPTSPRHAEALGIATVFQEINLIPHLSIAENICLGREPTQFGRIRWPAVRQRARAALARLGLAIDVRRELDSCSIAIQQLVAIARALDIDAKILILDEPTSSLDRSEVANLFDVMRRLRDQGLGILFVTHFLDQVYAVADRITVLRDGRFVAEHATCDLPRSTLVGLMVGRELDLTSAAAPADNALEPTSAPLLEAKALSRHGCVEHADLSIHVGQTVSLAGLLGSGRTETARLLFGADRFDKGQLLVDGQPVRFRAPRHAIARRIALTPENRKDHGIIPALSVRENIELALRARGRPRLSHTQSRQLAERYIKALNIKTPGPETPVSSLSGGNQQKVLLARWLATQPRLLILDEPTRGIDVAAKAEIIREIDHLRRAGMAILFISSELEEVVRVSQRVVVLRDRRTVAQLAGAQITEQAVLAAIAGNA